MHPIKFKPPHTMAHHVLGVTLELPKPMEVEEVYNKLTGEKIMIKACRFNPEVHKKIEEAQETSPDPPKKIWRYMNAEERKAYKTSKV